MYTYEQVKIGEKRENIREIWKKIKERKNSGKMMRMYKKYIRNR